MRRRNFISGTMMTAAIAATRPLWAAQSRSTMVTGPITGGRHGRPLAAYPKDLASLGYVEEEYFVSAEAGSYRLIGEITRDGKWKIEPNARKSYTTRLLVHRPKDPVRFNGTVLVEWINVTPGNDNVLIPDDPIYEGFAYVGVSAQAVGVHGFPDAKPDANFGLTSWDPVRYKPLAHPGDSFSFDIYHQVGRLLKNRSSSGVDPLGGLQVRKIIATGASQSAARLRNYINAVHPLDPVYDGFVPFLDFGNATSFADGAVQATGPTGTSRSFRTPTRIRDDLTVPVIVVNTEQESEYYRGGRADILQPDTDHFRLWEVAGAPHSPALPTIRAAIGRRDGFRREVSDSGPTTPVPTFPGAHVTSWHCTIAALYHMHAWINGGAPPPHAPRMRFVDGSKLVRDTLDIGTGGIRLPETEVPLEMNTGLPEDPAQRSNRGISSPFAPELIARLYGSHEDYVARVTTAALAAQSAGFIRPYRVQQYINEAQAAKIPSAKGSKSG